MKRSDVEKAIEWAKKLLDKCGFTLPAFAYWDIETWRSNSDCISNIKNIMLGWDITDYGMGDFKKVGSVLFTIRNGNPTDTSMGTPYAEKVIPVMDGQRLPMHRHKSKTEDIINRGGGVMYMKLYNSLPNGLPDQQSDVIVFCDGIKRVYGAGEEFYLTTGNSVTLVPGIYHIFGAKQGQGDLLAGEVSSINDDRNDNVFYEKVSRFSEIEEDVPILVPLCNEYDKFI